MIENRNFYIDGAWTAPQDGSDFPVIDPSTEERCAVISLGGQADTDAAVAAANSAFPAWSATPLEDRLALITRILDCYNARADEMSEAISLEMGAPIELAREQQTPLGASHIKSFIHAAKDFVFQHPLGPQAPTTQVRYEPIGVCGLITPWNWPMNQITLKVMPALLAGCTVVLKPSEISPLSALLFAEVMDGAGTPPGVFNLVNGDGPGVGTQLSGHPDVQMVSFTGSTRAGIAISKNAADTLKRVSLELGGKGANIVFADADPDAVTRGVLHCFNNAGQSCSAPTRMLVERPRYEAAVDEAVRAADAMTFGQSGDVDWNMGPVVSEAQFDKIQNLIETGISEGARLAAGGPGRPEGVNRGYYCRATVFADVTNEMQTSREEIFGPVLSIMPFDTEEEAIAIANDTPYGLSNYVQSEDSDRRNRVALSLRSGTVEMNGTSRGAGCPFGGVKASGNGREGGKWGLEDFLEVKAISGWG
ncbi:MAG: aldehyde dehydrogenase family protein [Pseudomonadota bacterium]